MLAISKSVMLATKAAALSYAASQEIAEAYCQYWGLSGFPCSIDAGWRWHTNTIGRSRGREACRQQQRRAPHVESGQCPIDILKRVYEEKTSATSLNQRLNMMLCM
jgi:hypothetical protein